jgi:hypothetical protein
LPVLFVRREHPRRSPGGREPDDGIDLFTATFVQSNGLDFPDISSMNMGRLTTVKRDKEKAIGTF